MLIVCLQLQQFASMSGVNIIQSSIDQALTQTRTNIGWMATHFNAIRSWLQSLQNPTTPTPPAPGSYRYTFPIICYKA
jgi:hypothetical protein